MRRPVKVYASWCKTCRVFDVRYRKLAAELGDTYDAETGTDIAQPGRVRFAEMKYDDPNNEEMCKLLNATKLPYVFLYKGSKGQVDEFQCGPAQFRRLIDAVHEHADPAEDGEAKPAAESPPPPREGDATMPVSEGGETLEGLREQRDALEREKLDMFEIMKAQIEHDKAYIQQLETGVENQRAMLDAQEGQVSKITHEMEQQRALFQSTEADRETLADDLRRQTVTTQRARDELAAYKAHVHQLTQRISKIQGTITTVEAVASGNERAAREKESTLVRQREEWEKEKDRYERERNSLRKLSVLGLKRVGRGIRALALRIRRKGVT